MGLHHLKGVRISGISACVPQNTFNISQYEHFTGVEIKDFKKHVGIESKRYSNGQLTTSDLCFSAAQQLLADLKWPKEEIGIIVLATQTPDYILPASCIILQNRLGLNTQTIAFDVNLGCSGWVYGLSIVGGLMNTFNIKKALLLTGETAVIADYKDKSTFPLMGDAGTATALEMDEAGSMTFDLNTDGQGFSAIIAAKSGARILEGINTEGNYQPYVTLDSQKVLEFCLREVTPSVIRAMEQKSIADIDFFVFHQANKIMNESLRKKLGIPVDKFPYCLQQFGNTSSASIPLTMVTQLRDSLQSREVNMVCSGFGVGLSWASVSLQTSHIVCPELVEI